MISRRNLTLSLAAAMSLTAASSRPAAAQIYPFPPYRAVFLDSSVRIEASPREAEVYVDGYYAGKVDEFDGVFQRLRVEPGQHEIALYLDGYRTYRQQLYLARDRTFHLRAKLDPLAPGEAAEARPVPGARAALTGVQPRALPGTPEARPLPGTSGTAPAATGRLSVQVQPADAEIVIDGQPWARQGETTILVDVAEGRHVIQVRKPGYVGYLTEVDVRPGETTSVEVNLRTEP